MKNEENHEIGELRHCDIILSLQRRHGSTCGQCAADVRLFVLFFFAMGLVKKAEILIWCGRKEPPLQALELLKMGFALVLSYMSPSLCNGHAPLGRRFPLGCGFTSRLKNRVCL